jgi:tetratricopeptide (TPR) repeat protein
VIARNSIEVYKGKRSDVRQIGQDLGVRYILEGSLQSDGDKIRVTAQLIEASTGAHIWQERYDRPATDLFLVQDDITQKITMTLQGHMGILMEAERAATYRKGEQSLQAYDYWLLGGKQLVLFTEEGLHNAQSLFRKAVELDSNFEPAVRDLGVAYVLEIDFGFSKDIQQSIEIHDKYTRRALELDPADPFAVYQLGNNYSYRGQLAKATEHYEKALTLGPSDADLLNLVSWAFPQLGLTDRAVELADQSVRLNPHYPLFYNYGLRVAYFYGGEFEKALRAQLAIGDAAPLDKIFLAMIYAQLGASDKAAHAAAAAREADPNWSAEQYASDIGGFVGEAEVNRLIESAKKADLPACLTVEQLQKRPDTKRLKSCDSERAQSAN